MAKQQEQEKVSVLQLLDYYPFEVRNITLLSSKDGKAMWEVQTDQGTKILKQMNIRPDKMLFIAGAHEHLVENGLRIAPIHKTKNGGLCLGAGDISYVLYDKVEGNEFTYYNKDQLHDIMKFISQFHHAAKGYVRQEESKLKSRLGKWHKMYRWKLQELEGNKQIALANPNDAFSKMFLEHVDTMLARGKKSLLALDDGIYDAWVQTTMNEGGFCQQDFTVAHFVEVDSAPFMRELHSIMYDLPSRDLRVLLNKVMKKLSIWDTDLAVELLRSYDSVHPLTKDYYRILWMDLAFPHLFCSLTSKYYLGQNTSWSADKYIWTLQNIITVESSKEQFLKSYSKIMKDIKG